MLPTRSRGVAELPSSELVDDDDIHDRTTANMPIAAAYVAARVEDDDLDTGIYARPNEVDLLLAMVDASEASGSILIEID